MKKTKDIILDKAYSLFLEKGYDAVSISMIQKEAEIGRATMYHHFSSKRDLFLAAVAKSLTAYDIETDFSKFKGLLLSDYIKLDIQQAKQLLEHSDLSEHIGMLNHFILFFKAMELEPDYTKIADRIHSRILEIWKFIIKNSISQGEVRQDIDIEKSAKLFMDARHGINMNSMHNTSMMENINKIKEMYEFVFTLIKS
jgi:AcrR family transcriptional regulator